MNDAPIATATSCTLAEDAVDCRRAASDATSTATAHVLDRRLADARRRSPSRREPTYTPVANYNGLGLLHLQANDGSARLEHRHRLADDHPGQRRAERGQRRGHGRRGRLDGVGRRSRQRHGRRRQPAHAHLRRLADPWHRCPAGRERSLHAEPELQRLRLLRLHDLRRRRRHRSGDRDDDRHGGQRRAGRQNQRHRRGKTRPRSSPCRRPTSTGMTLGYSIVSGPTHGTLSGERREPHVHAERRDTGPDSFTFKANDGTVDSNVATVSIMVTPRRRAPLMRLVNYVHGSMLKGTRGDMDAVFMIQPSPRRTWSRRRFGPQAARAQDPPLVIMARSSRPGPSLRARRADHRPEGERRDDGRDRRELPCQPRSRVSGVTLADGEGVGTITDDDAPVALTIGSAASPRATTAQRQRR